MQNTQTGRPEEGRRPKPPLIRPNVSGLAHLPSVQLRSTSFVNWTLSWVDNRWAKIPLQADGRPAAANNPHHMQTLSSAIRNAFDPQHRSDGVGIALFKELGVVGIDLDNCRNPLTGELTSTAQQILGRLSGAYTEVSVSGKGVHVLAIASYSGQRSRPAKKPADGTGIELYRAGRYFTLTGQLVQLPSRSRLRPDHDFSTELQAIYDQFLQADTEVRRPLGESLTPPPRPAQPPQGLERYMDRLLKGRTPFQREAADYFRYGCGDADHSQADFRFVLALLHVTGDDAQLTDALFRMSALYRPDKWNSSRGSSTYGWVTISNALMRRKKGRS